jgi:Lipoprotein LpqB beta-propeller domain
MAEHHLDRRQVLRAMLLGAAGLAVPAACGVPSGGHPVVDGPGPSTGPGTGGANRKAPTPADASTPAALVTAFLGAVAGRLHFDGNGGDTAKAAERAAAFLTSPTRQTWQPGSQITVVRNVGDLAQSTGDQAGSTFVDASLLPVGTLGLNGIVSPPPPSPSSEPVSVRFTVVPNTEPGRPGLYLINKIDTGGGVTGLGGMMLEAANLEDLYSPQLIYFWSTGGPSQGLVPDLRYVPRVGISQEIQLTEVVDWILGPASDIPNIAVQSTQYSGSGTSLVGPNLTAPDSDGLLVNLTIAPQGLSPDQVVAQLRWSLRPLYNDAVRLQINSQPQQVDGGGIDFRRRNLADEPFRSADETEFCIANNVVRKVSDPAAVPPVLNDPATNRDVELAALSRDMRYAALVKTDGRLFIGSAQGNDKPTFTIAQLPGRASTRPAFLPVTTPRVLVGVGGQLYLVRPDGEAVQLQLPVGRPVTAFAVAPDGHRVGLVSNGAAYVCGLKVNNIDDLTFGPPRLINTELSDCTGIAWSRLDRVLVAGQRGSQFRLVEATIDGAIAKAWLPFSGRILSVVAQPPLPWLASGPGVAMVQTANGAYEAFLNHNDPLQFPTSSQPSPSPSTGGSTVGLGIPKNPFYLD